MGFAREFISSGARQREVERRAQNPLNEYLVIYKYSRETGGAKEIWEKSGLVLINQKITSTTP